MVERVTAWHDLVKKPSTEGSVDLKGVLTSNAAAQKFVTAGPDDVVKARSFTRYRNISGSGTGYTTPGTRIWPVSQRSPYTMGGTGIVTDTGTIRCIDSEGGTYGIITSDGNHYLPSNLPEKYAKDGLMVEFKAITMPINPAYRMWGSPVRIISISPDPTKEGTIKSTGTVTWVPLEGGFYGIIADDGTQYDPLNLPDIYAHDGLRIEFTAIEEPDVVSFHMWGMFITITDAAPTSQGGTYNKERTIESTGTVTWVPLEGGFYGIIADDGTQYDPLNLPDEYAYDGFRIGFTATEEPDMASIHMWGMIVTITDATPISQDGTYNKEVIVDYKRTGGFAGFDDHLTVYENGVAIVTTKNGGNRYTMSSTEMSDLVALFESSGFNSVNQEDLPMFKISGADFFFYSIEYRGHKIEAIEYAFPETLAPLIERLNDLVLQSTE